MESGTSEAVTEGIRVAVRSEHVDERSFPAMSRHFFVYHITIENRSPQPVQLTDRHWVITNGHGDVEEVQGRGVVGVQPTIDPGESFEYASACPLDTPVGSMKGSFRMLREDGTEFEAQIESFALVAPHSLN